MGNPYIVLNVAPITQRSHRSSGTVLHVRKFLHSCIYLSFFLLRSCDRKFVFVLQKQKVLQKFRRKCHLNIKERESLFVGGLEMSPNFQTFHPNVNKSICCSFLNESFQLNYS